jgi:hypothetical protein
VHCGGVTPFKGRSLRVCVCCLLGCWVADGRRAAAHYANEAPRAACTYGPMVLMRVSRASLSPPSPGAPRGQRCIARTARVLILTLLTLVARCREHTSEILIPRRRRDHECDLIAVVESLIGISNFCTLASLNFNTRFIFILLLAAGLN